MAEILGPFLENMPYFGLFLVLMACGMGLPLPEDVPLILSGWAVHKGVANSETWMIVTGMLGVLAGDSMLFMFGWRFGESIVEHKFLRRLTTPSRVLWAERLFNDHGAKIVFAARFMPGARAVLFMTAGICRLRYWKFLLIDGLAAMISVPLWIILGSRFGPEVEKQAGGNAKLIIFGTLGLVLAVWFAWEWRQHRKRKQEELARGPVELPHAHDPRPVKPAGIAAAGSPKKAEIEAGA